MDVATTPPVTGMDLRVARTRAHVKLIEVAAAAGLSRQRIYTIETSARPTALSVERYLAALADARPGAARPAMKMTSEAVEMPSEAVPAATSAGASQHTRSDDRDRPAA